MDYLNEKAEQLRLERELAVNALKENLLETNPVELIFPAGSDETEEVLEYILRRPAMMISVFDTLTTIFLARDHSINKIFSIIKPLQQVIKVL